ncbi:MAG: enoyl-[acyl-carrier-protein] reductase [Gemmatimonadetes bacterium]|nr:MAG: enoyl-[acyl-carrier-protein] reductase [Gemmatimonadota bacterium]
MLPIDLSGKRAFVAGVADDRGYGWAIARALAQAGASVCVGTWPPTYSIFTRSLERGKLDRSLPDGGELEFERIYPLDAVFDTPEDVPDEIREDKRYRELSGYTIQEVADRMREEFGEPCLDVLVHSLANGPEVQKPLLDTSRPGYLAAVSASAYSLVALVQRFGPLMREGGGVVSLSYLAAERVVPGYGGGMSSAKAALEADTRTLAYEAGRRWGIRVNTISAGPLPSRAAKAIGKIDRMVEYYRKNAALPDVNTADDVGHAAAFLCSPLGAGITGETLHVDKGYHAMGMVAEDQLGDG